MSEKKNVFQKIKGMNRGKKIQAITASVLTAALMISIPSYAWLNRQREIARLERIKSPDMLFITAADREDKININMDNIDVNAEWKTNPATKATYKYFVFSVAGQYVTNYNLQLAHTKNNHYKYEVFEAVGTTTRPAGVEDRDYVAYDRDGNIPTDLRTINSKYGTIQTNPTIYYQINEDYNHTPISLNQGTTYTITPASNANDAVTKSYDGHYLNLDSSSGENDYNRTANSSGIYHNKTYEYSEVEIHSEPLYWQVTKIPVELDGTEKKPFYHEYILKVSWDENANLASLSKYKDTDIVYITVSVK